jgi:leucyl-tRNA synthetase
LSFDWSREVKTSDPIFYKWTQWIFIQLFHSWYNQDSDKAEAISTLIKKFEQSGSAAVNAHHNSEAEFSAEEWNSFDKFTQRSILLDYRLAYRAETVVNWCPALGTVLANDEVINGVSERGGHPVEQKKMMQWSLRIRAYAERLLNDLESIEWTDSLKDIQRNWIGKSEGAEIDFKIVDTGDSVRVFTTRPDTIYGATFIVLAPEHPVVNEICTEDQKEEIEAYIQFAAGRSERERMAEVKDVTGAFTGAYAINPISKVKIPIWISDYVLAGYGTGAVMAVPSGDQRDWDFAKKFNLEIIPVIKGQDVSNGADDRKDGELINSGELSGITVKDAIPKVIDKIEAENLGEKRINYKLRDAVFSRQRYWGEPFPIYYKDDIPYTIDEDKLDEIKLPEIDNFKPTEQGEPPLGRATHWNWNNESGKVVENGKGYPMDLNTMPGWAGSNWYFLRYMMEGNDPKRSDVFVSEEAVKYWRQIDLYMGGAEHATGHLLYFRFITKVLHDLGYIPFNEPAKKLINQGMIQAEDGHKMSKRCDCGIWC